MKIFTLVVFFSLSCQCLNYSYYLFLKGLVYEYEGKFNEALREYKRTLLYDEDAIEVYKRIITIYMNLGRVKEVVEYLDKLEKKELDTSTLLFLADVYAFLLPPKSITILEKVHQKMPKDLEVLYRLIKYYQQYDSEKALEYIKKYLQISPRERDMYLLKGLVLEDLKRIKEAEKTYHEAIRLSTYTIPIVLHLAEMLRKQNEYGKAIPLLEEILKKEPKNIIIIDLLLDSYYFNKDYKKMKEVINGNLLKFYPENVVTYYWLSLNYQIEKEYKKARKYLKKIKPQTPQTAARMGYLYLREEKPKKAIKILKKAIEKDHDIPCLYFLLGVAYWEDGKGEPAIKALKEAIALDPDFIDAYYHLGMVHDRMGNFDESVEYFKRVIELEPNNASALNYLGYIYAERGINLDEAEELIKRALKIEPENGAYVDSLGWVYFQKGKYREAEKYLLKAVELLPDDPVIYEHIGEVKKVLGDKQEAIKYWEEALKFNPKNKSQIKKKIKQLIREIKISR